MTVSIVSTSEAPPLWDFVPVADYSLPEAPVAHSVKRRLSRFWHVVKKGNATSKSPLKLETDLHALSERQLAQVAPAPIWDDATEALHTKLAEWLAPGEATAPVVLVVGPPHSGHADVLMAWAEQQTRTVFQTPLVEQVLAGDESWFPQPQDDGSPWVLPALERAYVRHDAGIGTVRRFLDCASSGALGRGIIGCDSWAWAYLQHIWHGRLPVTLTLQAFDQKRLTHAFRQLANGSRRKPLQFRQANNGHYVLPSADPNAAESSQFLQVLAAHSRGNLGVAWAIWRASLRTEPNDEDVEAKVGEEASRSPQHTMWVKAWEELSHPELPPQSGQDEALVLHVLLLHNGLSFEVLQRCLPLAPNRVMETLLKLEESGLVARDNSLWQVTALGYPAARQFLQTRGYLTDAFLGGCDERQ